MAEPIPCPSCTKPLPIPPSAVGKSLACPGCQERLTVRDEDGELQLALVDERPSPAPKAKRPVRKVGGRIQHKQHGVIDADAEPAGPPPPTVIALYVFAGFSVACLFWATTYLQSGVRIADVVGEQMLEDAGMRTDSHVTADGLGFTPATVGALAMAALAYLAAIFGTIQGRRWSVGLFTAVSIISLLICIFVFHGMPWTYPWPIQAYTWSQVVVLVLPWLPLSKRWLQAKDADRVREAISKRRGARSTA